MLRYGCRRRRRWLYNYPISAMQLKPFRLSGLISLLSQTNVTNLNGWMIEGVKDLCTWFLLCSIAKCVSRTRTSLYEIPCPNLLAQVTTCFDPVFRLIKNENVACFDVCFLPLLVWYRRSWPIEETKRVAFGDCPGFLTRIPPNKRVVNLGVGVYIYIYIYV